MSNNGFKATIFERALRTMKADGDGRETLHALNSEKLKFKYNNLKQEYFSWKTLENFEKPIRVWLGSIDWFANDARGCQGSLSGRASTMPQVFFQAVSV
jgi:hypothetical protein